MSETTSVPARRQSARLSRKRESEPEVSQPVKQSRTSETKKQDKPATTPTATASPKALRVGDALPDLTLLDQDEKPVKVAELRKAVIFTYPKVCSFLLTCRQIRQGVPSRLNATAMPRTTGPRLAIKCLACRTMRRNPNAHGLLYVHTLSHTRNLAFPINCLAIRNVS